MLENETWVVTGWEKGMARTMENIVWMRNEYRADDAEIELEAMAQRLTTAAGTIDINASSEAEKERARQLYMLGIYLMTRPARISLSKKHNIWSEERKNGQIQ